MNGNSSLILQQIVSSDNFIDNVKKCDDEFISLITRKENIDEMLGILIPQNGNHDNQLSSNDVLQNKLLQIFLSDKLLNILSEDSNVILYLENYIKSYLNDDGIVLNTCIYNLQIFAYIVQKLCKTNEGAILQNINIDSQLSKLLINNLQTLSIVEFFLLLLTGYSEYVSIDGNSIQKLIAVTTYLHNKNSSPLRIYYTFLFIQKLITNSQKYQQIICDPPIIGALLSIASNSKFDKSVSHACLNIVKIAARQTNIPDVQVIIKSFETIFNSIQSLDDSRIPILVHLYHSRVNDLIIPFFLGKTSTFTNFEIISVIKNMESNQLHKVVTQKDFQKIFMISFTKNRTNGHITKLGQILIEKCANYSQFKTLTWNKFKDLQIIPRIQKCTSTSFESRSSFFPSCETDSPPLKSQLKKILDNNDDA